MVCTVLKCQLTFLGHLLRMDPCEPAHRYALYMLYHPPHGGRQPGGTEHQLYTKYIQEHLGDGLGMLTPSQIANLALDRTMWHKVVVNCSAAEG